MKPSFGDLTRTEIGLRKSDVRIEIRSDVRLVPVWTPIPDIPV